MGLKDPIKVPILRLQVLLWKFGIFLMPFSKIFQTPSQFFFKFYITLHVMKVSWKITPLYFFRSNNKYFPQKEPMKMQIFETFECSGQNLPNSCHFWNNRSVFLQISHQSSGSWDITPLHFLAKILYAIKVKIWWNFTWAVQSLKFCTLLLCSNFAPFAQIMYSFS